MSNSDNQYNYTPLPEPIPVTEQHWPDDVLPLVCTRTMCFNHEAYIRDCIEGLIMQKTTFPVRIVIHDDASTDNSPAIIREYEQRYPALIKVVYQKENTFTKPDKILRRKALSKLMIGRYTALCEGDDYWTDPLKLQKQVDFMEANPDCTVCFHAAIHFSAENPSDQYIHRPKSIPLGGKFKIEDVILGGGGFMTTNSMLMRKEVIGGDKPKWMKEAPVGDGPLALYLALMGNLGYIDETMSAYRRFSSKHSWSNSMRESKNEKMHFFKIKKMWEDFDSWTEFKFHTAVQKRLNINRKNYYKSKIKRFINSLLKTK